MRPGARAALAALLAVVLGAAIACAPPTTTPPVTTPVVVTASSTTMVYGDAAPTITPTYSGLPSGTTAPTTPATCTTTATSTSPVGVYPTTCSGAVGPALTFTYSAGEITVTAAPVQVTASSASVTYGDAVPAITASYAGFVNGQTAPATPADCSTDATSASDVGAYDSTCAGAADPNHSFDYVDGAVSVDPAAVTVTASSSAVTFGSAVPAVTASYAGLLNGDTVPATPPTCSTAATPSSPVGTYASTCSGAADPNYTFGYTDGTVTITTGAAPVTVTASSATATYGDTIGAITPSYSGFPGSQTAPSISDATCTTTATSTSPVGTYATTCSGAADADLDFTYVDGSITILPAAAVVTASSDSTVYGAPVPAITASYAGLLNGQTEPATAPTCSAAATPTSGVGSYATSCSGAADPNYTFNAVDGSLSITRAGVVVTASSASTTYGAPVPAITASYSGLLNGQTNPSTAPVCTTAATSTSTVGSYSTSCSGADDANYTFSYVDGTVTITAAAPIPVVVTASSATMGAGDAVPTVTASYAGLTDGDTAPSTPPACTTTATSFSPLGSYPTTCSGAVDAKYSFTYVAGTLTLSANGFSSYKTSARNTTIAAGSNGAALPQGTINVASASGLGFPGYVNLTVQTSAGAQSVFCTAVAATSFSGCTGGTGTMSTGGYVSDAAANQFDAYTISGGAAAVSPSSLTILSDVPAAARGIASTVSATATHGLITYVQSGAPTGTFSLTFGICSTGTSTYSAGDPNCRTGRIYYTPAVGSNIGAAVTVSIQTSNQYQTINVGTAGTAAVPSGQSFTSYLAPAGSAVPRKSPSAFGDATINTSSTFTSIYPIPAGMTYVSSSLIGGDVKTSGVATVKYCTATGTGCSAKLTGNYIGTTLPYLQVTLPTSTTIAGGGSVTMPTLALTLQATGSVGTVARLALTEYVNVTAINAPIIGAATANFDGYPTTGNNANVTPPRASPTTIFSTTIS